MILRRATLDDAGAIARLHRHTVRTSLAFLPKLHSPEDDLWFFRERLMVECETWVAEIDGVIAGYTAFKPEWLMHLYVHPDHQGAGVGPCTTRRSRTGRRGSFGPSSRTLAPRDSTKPAVGVW